MLLTECLLSEAVMVEADRSALPDGVLCRVRYPVCNLGQLNANRRLYEAAVWEKVLADKDLMEKVKMRGLFGHAEHPETSQSKLDLTSHAVIEMTIDQDKVYQVMDIFDTPTGRIVDCLLRASCNVGVSTRAEGELEEAESKDLGKYQRVIPESFVYITTDFTADPSTYGMAPVEVRRNVVKAAESILTDPKASVGDRRTGRKILESICSHKSEHRCKGAGCGACRALEGLADKFAHGGQEADIVRAVKNKVPKVNSRDIASFVHGMVEDLELGEEDDLSDFAEDLISGVVSHFNLVSKMAGKSGSKVINPEAFRPENVLGPYAKGPEVEEAAPSAPNQPIQSKLQGVDLDQSIDKLSKIVYDGKGWSQITPDQKRDLLDVVDSMMLSSEDVSRHSDLNTSIVQAIMKHVPGLDQAEVLRWVKGQGDDVGLDLSDLADDTAYNGVRYFQRKKKPTMESTPTALRTKDTLARKMFRSLNYNKLSDEQKAEVDREHKRLEVQASEAVKPDAKGKPGYCKTCTQVAFKKDLSKPCPGCHLAKAEGDLGGDYNEQIADAILDDDQVPDDTPREKVVQWVQKTVGGKDVGDMAEELVMQGIQHFRRANESMKTKTKTTATELHRLIVAKRVAEASLGAELEVSTEVIDELLEQHTKDARTNRLFVEASRTLLKEGDPRYQGTIKKLREDLADVAMKYRRVFDELRILKESQHSRMSQTDEQEEAIKNLEATLKSLNKNVWGGTTVGRSPQTVILDLSHQGSEIRIDPDGKVEINDEVVDPADSKAVQAAIALKDKRAEESSQLKKDKEAAEKALTEQKAVHEVQLAKIAEAHAAELAAQALKTYIQIKVKNSGIRLTESSLALLRACQSETEIDDVYEGIMDALASNALHSELPTVVREGKVEKKIDPQVQEVYERVTLAAQGMRK